MRRRRLLVAGLSLALIGTACGSDDSGNDQPAAVATATADDAATALADFSCPQRALDAGSPRSGPAAGGRLQVVTTVAPITSIVANIAGDRADVHGVIPEGTNSHTYEPKPSIAKLMSSADLILVNGLDLEDQTKEIAQENKPADAQVLEMGSLTIDEAQYIYDFSFPRDGGKPNPHLWTNPPMADCYAAIATSAMSNADPANADYYRANYVAYSARVRELDRLMTEASADMPVATRELLTYHDAYAYFAVHYDWRVIGAIQVSDFEDPTPKEVAELIDQIGTEQVPAIFGSEVFPSPVLAQIGKESGASYVDTLRDDDLPGAPGDPEHSYLGLMQADFVTMVGSLGGDPAALAAFDPSDVAPDHADYPQ
jgi:ABC-type Zn uptake system ZnuABC Zn-binding protein ZnuA